MLRVANSLVVSKIFGVSIKSKYYANSFIASSLIKSYLSSVMKSVL